MDNSPPDHGAMVGRTRKTIRKAADAAAESAGLYIGQWIRALGKRPIDVVKATGINEGYLSELINGGKKNPSAAVLLEIAKFLDIPLQYFYRPPPNRDFIEEASTLDPSVLTRLRRPNWPARKQSTRSISDL